MTSKYTNKNGVKLLAALMVFAVAFAGIVVLTTDNDSSAEEAKTTTIYVGGEGAVDSAEADGSSEKPYATIAYALNATEGTTIVELKGNVSGDGWTNPSGRDITINFNTYTFTMDGKLVGSKNTESQVFQLLKNSNVTFNNGTITTSVANSAMIIQNYSNLTLNNMVLDGSKLCNSNACYTLSCNNGIVKISGNTSIKASETSSTSRIFAFDACWNSENYPDGAAVTLDTTGTITGNIEVGDWKEGSTAKTILNLKSGTVKGDVYFNTNSGSGLVISDSVDVKVKIASGKTVTGSISFGNNTITLDELKTDGETTFSKGSVIIEGDIDDSTPGKIVVLSGEAKLKANIPAGMIVTIDEGATLTIPSGTTITNAGTIDVKGTLNNDGTLTKSGDGTVTITNADATISGTNASSITPSILIDSTGKTPISSTILAFEGDVVIDGDAYLIGDLEIPAEKKLVIRSTGTLDLNGYGLTINGEFIVESGAKVFGSDVVNDPASTTPNTIILMKGASIQNDGILGAVKAITVKVGEVDGKYDGVGEVSLLNGSGIEFGLANTTTPGNTKAEYTLTVTGDVYSDITSKIEMMKVRIINDLTIGENVTLSIPNVTSNDVYLMSGATLTIDGELNVASSNAKLIMKNKSTVIMNGIQTGKITAETGDYATSAGYTSGETTVEIEVSGAVATKNYGMTGYTLTVSTFGYQKTISGVKTSMTCQALYINGDLDYTNSVVTTTEVCATTMKLTGNDAYIADGSIISLLKGMNMNIDGDHKLQVLGQVISDSSSTVVDKYIGASYTIKNETTKVTTTYIEPFASAITKIADADKKTVVVRGDVEIDGTLTILENQILDIKEAKLIVKESGILTVDAKGKIDGAVNSVEGVLKVMKNGTCSAPTSYASITKSADYTQYSGLKIAIKNAQPGETITIVSPAEVSDLEIPAGVTVESSAKITVKGNMTIAETAKVVLKDGTGEIDITKAKAKITVNGELDATDGKITLTGTNAQIYSEGKTTIANSQSTLLDDSNAFVYVNDENQYVLTNAEDAIAAVAAMDVAKNVDVYGTVSAGDLDLNTNMNIETESKVTFGNITIADGKEITVNGEVTGTFSVTTGIPETTGATVTSTIDLQKASGIVIGATSEVDAQNVKTYIFYIYGSLIGTADITEGTVSVGKDGSTTGTTDTLTVNKNGQKSAYLTIDEEATFNVRSGMNLVVGYNVIGDDKVASVIVDGTLDVVKGGEVTSAVDTNPVGILDISGTFVIGNEATVEFDGMILMNGAIEISTTENKEGKLEANGSVFMFDGASISGKIDVTTANYILAYVGADVSKALINVNASGESAAFATAFYINSDICMTAYAITSSTVKTFDVIKSAEFDVPGYDLSNIKKTTTETGTTTYWYTDADLEDEVDKVGTVLVKTVPAVYFNAPKATITGTISAGVGLQIYLNGISVENYKVGTGYTLPVGTYKVTIENLSGYDKSKAVISFNGATIADGGSITISEKDFVLTATGAVPAVTPTPEPTPIQPTEKDDGMGLTEYLLIVLVVLAAILVVVVAIRMMRS